MKIIISHDVDHLYPSDHFVRDLIIPKLWIRSFLHLCSKKITVKTFFNRLTIPFKTRMNRIEEVMAFDKMHRIPSVFFFGMDRILGMSYSQEKAVPFIKKVIENGFDVGVHGVNYTDIEKIKKERDDFCNISALNSFGIRNHYVRFDDNTFEKMADAGYLFDSTWFNKQELDIRAPYKVGKMWEFPLHIMDGYITKVGDPEVSLRKTFDAIKLAEERGMPYCTILFHDYQYDDRINPQMKEWYEKTVMWCENEGYEFISYRDAIKELEKNEQNSVRK